MLEGAILVLVLVLLLLVKFVGYVLFARMLATPLFAPAKANMCLVAGARVVLGAVATVVVVGMTGFTQRVLEGPDPTVSGVATGGVAFFGQLFARLLIWLFIAVFFYDRTLTRKFEIAWLIATGTLWSYVLDVPNYLLLAAGALYELSHINFC